MGTSIFTQDVIKQVAFVKIISKTYAFNIGVLELRENCFQTSCTLNLGKTSQFFTMLFLVSLTASTMVDHSRMNHGARKKNIRMKLTIICMKTKYQKIMQRNPK